MAKIPWRVNAFSEHVASSPIFCCKTINIISNLSLKQIALSAFEDRLYRTNPNWLDVVTQVLVYACVKQRHGQA